jgi:hypothetical protein
MSQAYSFESSVFPPGAVVQKLTGDSGGAVGPDGNNNINLIGGTDIVVTGNPGTNTITIATTGTTNINWTNVDVNLYAALPTDEYLSVDCSVHPVTILLPDHAVKGKTYIVKDRTGSAETNTIFVTTASSITLIDGVTSYTLPNEYSTVQVIGNDVSYEIY